jgi:5-(carboxyamino)imidazole ribonucleotide mutase
MPKIGIIVGSASDLEIASKAAETLSEFGVEFEVGIASAHRTPNDVENYAKNSCKRGIIVIIAMAVLSAALPGVIAAHTALPVIAVPIASGPLGGVDALLASVQMPPGVPVGCLGINGAKNAALLALRIIATGDENLSRAIAAYTEKSKDAVTDGRKKTEAAGMPSAPDDAYA